MKRNFAHTIHQLNPRFSLLPARSKAWVTVLASAPSRPLHRRKDLTHRQQIVTRTIPVPRSPPLTIIFTRLNLPEGTLFNWVYSDPNYPQIPR
jgi:hypothetical protein